MLLCKVAILSNVRGPKVLARDDGAPFEDTNEAQEAVWRKVEEGFYSDSVCVIVSPDDADALSKVKAFGIFTTEG